MKESLRKVEYIFHKDCVNSSQEFLPDYLLISLLDSHISKNHSTTLQYLNHKDVIILDDILSSNLFFMKELRALCDKFNFNLHSIIPTIELNCITDICTLLDFTYIRFNEIGEICTVEKIARLSNNLVLIGDPVEIARNELMNSSVISSKFLSIKKVPSCFSNSKPLVKLQSYRITKMDDLLFLS